MTFDRCTEAYEAWLRTKIEIVEEDLAEKHALMREAVFPFLRATFYRWAGLFKQVCPDAAEAPETLAVGDLHIENFGTWRDVEGRLVWGINDFDEAAVMPWTIDLVRLAASTHLAIDGGHFELDRREACHTISAGYREGLEAGGSPLVLGERHQWLSELVALPTPAAFWAKMHGLTDYKGRVPKAAKRALERLLPGKDLPYRVAHRVAGIGSRGRQRFVAIAEFEGGHVCREAKALAPSAWCWANGSEARERLFYQEALETSIRALDPFVHTKNRWIVRRLAPDCAKIELASVPKDKEKSRLLHAMGWETANVHVGGKRVPEILRDLTRRKKNWLHDAAAQMVKATKADWEAWRGGKARASGT